MAEAHTTSPTTLKTAACLSVFNTEEIIHIDYWFMLMVILFTNILTLVAAVEKELVKKQF
jgi:hypothetical protein